MRFVPIQAAANNGRGAINSQAVYQGGCGANDTFAETYAGDDKKFGEAGRSDHHNHHQIEAYH